jgi:hypothetical protein
MRRPGSDVATKGGYHNAFPSWAEFWADTEIGDEPVRPPAELYRFLETFRRGAERPRVNPRGSSPDSTA